MIQLPYLPPISEGLLGNLVGNIENLIPDLPGPIDDALKGAINHAVAVVDPSVPTPPNADAPPAPIIPPGTPPAEAQEHTNGIQKALDTMISGIGLVLRFRWLVPNEFEAPLETLAKALQKVRNWL